MTAKKPVALVILDGLGLNNTDTGNAFTKADTPNLDNIMQKYPYAELTACGEEVGLPEGQMGNSEVGHLNIGAGRVVYQEFTRISKSIESGEYRSNDELNSAMDNALKNNKALHLLGLLSDGGVHSHITHLFGLLELAKEKGLQDVYVHCILDGRDVPPKSSLTYIEQLEEKLQELGIGKIATVAGRYYTMDRDKRWDRVEKAYKAMVNSEGEKAHSAAAAVEKSYEDNVTDEFVIPTVIEEDAAVEQGDSIIFFNFRADRARQITRAFVDKDFDGFERPGGWPGVYFVCMTQYDKLIEAPVAFPPLELNNTLGEVLAQHNLKQLRIAETEKYAHVTFFFNGGVEKANEGEDRVLIPSPDVATYDMKPEMSAYEVTAKVIENINDDSYDVVILNFANPDMVGHTGDFDAAVKAVETVDENLGKVLESVKKAGGAALVTADHGNCEIMCDESGKPHTAHSTNKVPFILIGMEGEKLKEQGSLRDIAPTILKILGVTQPEEMTGESLIRE